MARIASPRASKATSMPVEPTGAPMYVLALEPASRPRLPPEPPTLLDVGELDDDGGDGCSSDDLSVEGLREALRALLEAEQPDLVVPEIEAIATPMLEVLEATGVVRVIPTARAARLTMDREGIRRLAAETLGLPTSPYKFCDSLDELQASLQEKSQAFSGIVKLGRTHLQDATPITLGQEFSGYAAQLANARQLIQGALSWLYPLAIGGTAVGTGLNTHPEFGPRVAAELARVHHMPFASADNKFAALAAHDALVATHGMLKTLAIALTKIANDIRWLASGPRSGLGEITIPDNEPGSSMMPGKVNPTQCEALTMLCAQVMGNDVAMGIGAASGHLELNVYKPLLAHNLLQSIRLLADGMRSFNRHCVWGIQPHIDRIDAHLKRSLMLVTALVPHLGYDRSAEIAKWALKNGSSLAEAALSLGYASQAQLDLWLQPAGMLGPMPSHANPAPDT